MSDASECCASGSCEVCKRPSGYSHTERERIIRDSRTYDPPWVREHRDNGWHSTR